MHLLPFLGLILFLSRISSCEDSFLWLLLNLSVELVISSEGFDLVSFLLFSDLLELLLGFFELLLFYSIEGFKLTFQIIEVPILIHISLLQGSEFLLQSLILLHESRLDSNEIAIPLLAPLQFSCLFLQLLLQLFLLVLHVGYVLGHLSSILLLLLHDGLNAGLYIGLIVAVAYSIHALEKFQGLGSYFTQLWLTGNGVVQPCAELADLIGELLVLLEVRDFGWEREGSGLFFFGCLGGGGLWSWRGTLQRTVVILRIYETASESAWQSFFGLSFILALTAKRLTIPRINSTRSFSSLMSSEISLCGSYFCASQQRISATSSKLGLEKFQSETMRLQLRDLSISQSDLHYLYDIF